MSDTLNPHRDFSTAQDAASFLSLPDELLLHVVQSLDGQGRQDALCNLSLVNHRFETIVRPEFYFSPSLRPNHAHHLTRKLLDEPKLAMRLTGISLVESPFNNRKLGKWDSNSPDLNGADWYSPSSFALLLMRRCLDTVRAHGVPDHSWRWAAGLQAGDSFAYVAVLLAITPNLKRLTISCQSASVLLGPEPTGPQWRGTRSRPYMGNVMQHSLQNLKELTIRPVVMELNVTFYDHSSRMRYLDLRSLNAVRRLDVPAHLFRDMDGMPNHLQDPKLPPAMQSLRITACTGERVRFLKAFLPNVRQAHPSLQEVECEWDDEGVEKLGSAMEESMEALMNRLRDVAKGQGVELRYDLKGRPKLEK